LRQLAVECAGYKARGVRGWAHLENVEVGTRSKLAEVLPLLHGRGMLDRVDVRVSGRLRPVWIYRVNASAERLIAETTGMPYQEIDPPKRLDANRPIYVPDRQRGALLLLRQAHDDPGTPVRFGARGWVTGRELGARKEAWNEKLGGPPFVAVDTTDLRWLALWRLIERHDAPPTPGRQTEVVYWRATEFGRSAKLLEWKSLA
jgi:hypothetical protein